MIKYIKGDVIKALKDDKVDYLLHCCNAQGVMGSGIARQVKEQFPEAYKAYMFDYTNVAKDRLLGTISGDSGVINAVTQQYYGYDGKRYTNYGALASCLSEIFYHIQDSQECDYSLKGRTVIGIPYKMASDRGGADWGIVLELVEHLLSWAGIYIYHLGDLG